MALHQFHFRLRNQPTSHLTKMKFLISAVLVFAAVQALPSPSYIRYGAVPVASQSTYHAQDELGQYSFGYHEPNQVRSETKDAFGIVRGSYSYTNADGSIVTNNYIADQNGFRSSLAPSNGPLLPLVGKAPKVSVSHAPVAIAAAPVHVAPVAVASAPVHVAPVPVAATPTVKAEQPTVVKFAGGHVAPTPPLRINPYAYGYPASTYHYPVYASPYASHYVRNVVPVVHSW